MTDREGKIRFATILNILFALLQTIVGLLTNSLALLSNGLHDAGDSVALVIAWFMERKAKMPADKSRTFGYQRLSLFSSVFAAVALLVASFFILAKTIPRLIKPEHVDASGMVLMAVFGLVINGVGYLKLRGKSQNEKMLSWHLLDDVLAWIVILIGGILIKFWDNHIIDPILTLGITAFVIFGVIRNLKGTLNILLEGVPEHINIEKLKESIFGIKGVKNVHDIHVWSLDGEMSLLTAHVVVDEKLLKSPDGIRKKIKGILRPFNIEHSTLEIESEEFCLGMDCGLQDKNSGLAD